MSSRKCTDSSGPSFTSHRTLRRRSWLALGLVLLMVPLSGGAVAEAADEGDPGAPTSGAQAASRQEDGWVLVPTAPASRLYAFGALDGITHAAIEVDEDAPFKLRSYYGDDVVACLGPCVTLADFDVSFFRTRDDGSTVLVASHANIGQESGTTPAGATLAIVYLRAPGVLPDGRGYRFEYLQGEPGGDEVPDV